MWKTWCRRRLSKKRFRRWYRCRVLPQGWNASPVVFHEIVMRICPEYDVLHYIDDIFLGAATLRELGERVATLLERLNEYRLQVQRKKFEFSIQSLEFLGFTVQAGGREGAERHLTTRRAAVKTDIRTKRGLQSLLGTLNVARHFVPAMASKLCGLQQILKTIKGNLMTTEEKGSCKWKLRTPGRLYSRLVSPSRLSTVAEQNIYCR